MSFYLPDLPYNYEALLPYMSRETLEYHHDKHHLAYVTNGNKLLVGSGLETESLEEIVKKSFNVNASLFNNVAQHYNHIHFWQWMKKDGGEPNNLPSSLEKAIKDSFGDIDSLKGKFLEAANTQFGSGWAFIAVKDGKLEVMKFDNGANPLIKNATPILGIDVWEHSYYIDYRNSRPDYTKAFWEHLVNWDYVVELFEKAIA